ncbi:YceI family protein [uncultured Lutibacter sp.]|uniref:YceI family protein n=1 Tax=uncultured Lutibacter sp. TaxID=437739 RepID=UPI002611D6F7|nr:YceI family protein [uncultured Lutibacter sp.]
MKKVGILVVAIAFISMSFVNSEVLFENNVDVSSSTINWKGYKPTGSHNGTISLVSGELEMEEGIIIGGSFTVDMSTIKDADGSAKLEGHLKSEDFFEVETFPTSTFEITSSAIEDEKTMVTGDLTIKGITKQVTFPAVVSETEEVVTLTSETFQINRADFNVKYKSKSFFNDLKDKFVNDEFDLQVNIVVKK